MRSESERIQHVALLRSSFFHWTGKPLVPEDVMPDEAPRYLDQAHFAVVSHGIEPDPIFNYGNRAALQLFEMREEDFVALPSRLSAEPMAQVERDHLLQRVAAHGFIDDYTGIRISSSGRRFRILQAVVWNVVDHEGHHLGQAALLQRWEEINARPAQPKD
jgi:hypothetical protein